MLDAAVVKGAGGAVEGDGVTSVALAIRVEEIGGIYFAVEA